MLGALNLDKESEMKAPVDVKLAKPTVTLDNWEEQAEQWRKINPGNSAFRPLTVKAGYVIGVIFDICECVSHLFKYPGNYQSVYIPAYGVFASGVEILGRCLRGNPNFKNADKDLKFGFKWMASWESPEDYVQIPQSYKLVNTNAREYTIQDLMTLRHFAAHGQGVMGESATGSNITAIDPEILEKMPYLLKNSLEVYWSRLQKYPGHPDVSEESWNSLAEKLCNKLAVARITPFRDWPVFRCWSLFDPKHTGPYPSVTEVFERFEGEWSISTV
jgi:hypothetical protein